MKKLTRALAALLLIVLVASATQLTTSSAASAADEPVIDRCTAPRQPTKPQAPDGRTVPSVPEQAGSAPLQQAPLQQAALQQECVITGSVSIDAQKAGDNTVVRFTFINGASAAGIRFDELAVPAEVAADATCLAGIRQVDLPVDPTGDVDLLLGGRAAVVVFAQAVNATIECVFPTPETCGLTADIAMSWFTPQITMYGPAAAPATTAPLFTRSASALVSPACARDAATGPALVVQAEAIPRSVERFDTTTWHITVTNIGSTIISDAVITDQLHDALVPSDTLPSNVRFDATTRTITAQVPKLAPGESATITFPTQVIAWSQVPNWVTVASSGATAGGYGDVFGLINYFS